MKLTRTASAIALSVAVITLSSCSSDMDDSRPRGYPGDGVGARPRTFARAGGGAGDGLEMMPPAEWWRDPQISVAVGLSNDQTASLDRISHDQGDEIAKLERDSMVAARDVRQIVDSNEPAASDITRAAQRLRGIRDALFDHRVQMLAAERTLLTQKQWVALQQQLSASRNRPERMERGGYGGRGGRGGMGGRGGRFPG